MCILPNGASMNKHREPWLRLLLPIQALAVSLRRRRQSIAYCHTETTQVNMIELGAHYYVKLQIVSAFYYTPTL